jgi:hypothetical protein
MRKEDYAQQYPEQESGNIVVGLKQEIQCFHEICVG